MLRKNVYFFQPGFAFDRAYYLPYAAGALAAYAWRDDTVKNSYAIGDFIFKREKLNEVCERLDRPAVAAFSNYVWNFEYNKAMAKKIKALYPDCIVIFGGHNVPVGHGILDDCDFVDVLVHGEGEEPFLRLLKALPGGNLAEVPNISFRKPGGEPADTAFEVYKNIADYPSPYLSGVFDKLMEEHSEADFLSVLETNRGCPYGCSYCDWCAGKSVRFFSMEKVKDEIRWIADKKIEYCFCADSNFGMFPRDKEIVDFIVESKETTGYPQIFRPCYDKNSDDAVFEISKKLNMYGMDKGATMAYQTLSADALRNVNRKNLTLEHFSGLLSKYNAAGIPTYSELILGLPGETYDSFCDGVCRLLESGQHNSVSVYYLELLPNAEMAGEEYIKKHGLDVVRVAFNHIHSSDREEEVREYSRLVIGSNTMSREMWVKSNMFSITVQCFHNLGLLRCFAIYLYYEKNLGYRDFYGKLLDFIMGTQSLARTVFSGYEEKLKTSLAGDWNYHNELFGEANWFFEEGAFLELLLNHKRFREEIKPFLDSFKIEQAVYEDLLAYQGAIVKTPVTLRQEISLGHDLCGYFHNIYTGSPRPLEKKRCVLVINEQPDMSWKDYARETVWYGRRRGATLRTNNKGETSLVYPR